MQPQPQMVLLKKTKTPPLRRKVSEGINKKNDSGFRVFASVLCEAISYFGEEIASSLRSSQRHHSKYQVARNTTSIILASFASWRFILTFFRGATCVHLWLIKSIERDMISI